MQRRAFLLFALGNALAAQSPQYVRFGDGCAGSRAVATLTALSLPRTADTLRVAIDNLPANAAFMMTGLSRNVSAYGALPIALDRFGMPSCALRVSPDFVALVFGLSSATYELPLPSSPVLVGLRLYQQAVVLDPGAGNAAGAVVSEAVEAVIGLPGWPGGGTPVPGMVAVSAGSFAMGSTYGAPPPPALPEQPVHVVTITRPFWIGRHEVTQREYLAVMHTNPAYFPGLDRPVEFVSWHLAVQYCQALTAQELAAGHLPSGYEYRLPTEAEWEYCCRAGTSTEWNTGGALTCGQGNVYTCVGTTRNVGSYAANAWGLKDMHGNVGEWCLDGSSDYPSTQVSDPYNTGLDRIVRGGGWAGVVGYSRSACRFTQAASRPTSDTGFRVVLAPRLPLGGGTPLPDMVPIAPGAFAMGSLLGEPDEQPVHTVTITRPFWIGRYEVSQAQYQALIGTNPSLYRGNDRPVEQVTWYQATDYCARLTTQERNAGRLPSGYEYRLPTEAEWEFCCRAGTTTEWNVGNSPPTCAQANTHTCTQGTAPVTSGVPNRWGLYCMHGNVSEWCLDGHDGSPNYPTHPVVDPRVSMGAEHIIRGGGWDISAREARSANRNALDPSVGVFDLGFRVVLAPAVAP